MSDPKTRLIQTAVRPLADDAEMQLAATHLLGKLVIPHPENAEQAIQRWDVVDAKKRKPVWRMALWVLLVAVSAGVGVRDFRDSIRYMKWMRGAMVGGYMKSRSPGKYSIKGAWIARWS